jgi:hypothetical protein
MGWIATNQRLGRIFLLLFGVVALCLLATVNILAASGENLSNRSLTLSDSRAGATTNYVFRFQPMTSDPIQTVLLQICANDPFPGTSCTAPLGLDVSDAVLENQSGDLGFSISSQSTANQIVLERVPSASNAELSSYEFSGIISPSTEGSYYVRLQTFADGNIAGSSNGYGGIAFGINSSVDVHATVPPYLLLCVGASLPSFNCNGEYGNYVNFGEFDSRRASQASTQILAATNAVDGYTIRVAGRTLTSGNNEITALTGADVSRPGVSQFGMNLRVNSAPLGGQDAIGAGSGQPTNGYNQPNFFRFNSGDVVAASNAPDETRKYTVTYVVNINRDQPPGVYVSTLNYIALGSF